MALIHLFKGTVTAGQTDGTQVSEQTESNPITPVGSGPSGEINATAGEESQAQKMAVRCDTGYQTSGNTVLTPSGGSTANLWALAPDNAGTPGTWTAYGGSFTISNTVSDVNTLLWVKAKANTNETPVNDKGVDIQITANVVAKA